MDQSSPKASFIGDASMSPCDRGSVLRGFALLLNIVISVLWILYGELPMLYGEQTKLFVHVIPSFNVILLILTVVPFFETLEAFVHRILSLAGACLFALVGTVGVINYVILGHFQISSLCIALLCLLICLLLTADLLVLESNFPLERRDPVTRNDTWQSSIGSISIIDDPKLSMYRSDDREDQLHSLT